jgi:AcrR family transcriptional regulator
MPASCVSRRRVIPGSYPAPESSARPADPPTAEATRGLFHLAGWYEVSRIPARPALPAYPERVHIESPVEAHESVRDGRSTRWDPHRRERRLSIITAAIEAIEEYGPDVLTAQIAEKAGVPRTHVYRHFEGKPALDLAVSTHVANQIAQSIRAGLASGGTAMAIIAGAIDQHLSWVEEHPNLYRFLAQHSYRVRTDSMGSSGDAKAALAAELTTLIARYMAALGIDTEPAERVVVGVVGLVDATAAWWLGRDEPPRATIAAELTEQVWLLLDRTMRELGLVLDPRQPLPQI